MAAPAPRQVLPYLPESPRWHLIQGRKGEATATLAAIASYNRTRMPDVRPPPPYAASQPDLCMLAGMLLPPWLRPAPSDR